MNNLALWMAEQICSLQPYLGLHACGAVADHYLIGVAGWIFGGIFLLMLMGISDEIERRKAARLMREFPDIPKAVSLTGNASAQQTQPREGIADKGNDHRAYIPVRGVRRRRYRSAQGVYVPKAIQSANAEGAGSSGV